MRAVWIEEFGGLEVVKLADLPAPRPGADEVRIAVHAASVNFADTLMVSGKYQATPPPPFTPGMEVAGEVIEIGENIKWFKPGDPVIAVLDHGGYAEEVLAHHSRIMHVPPGMTWEQAAGVPIVYGTSHLALTHRTHLKAGETMLVHGAAGGAGLTAVEVGKALGATVIGTAGSDEKVETARANGYDHVIAYRREDFVSRVREITDGAGVAVVYDGVGAETFRGSLDCLRPLGMMVTFGNASGPVPPVDLALLSERGSLFLTRPTLMTYTAKREDLVAAAEELFAVVGSGAVKIEVNQTYPLAEAAQAHRDLEARKTTGSTVLLP